VQRTAADPTLRHQTFQLASERTAPSQARRLCEHTCREWSLECVIDDCDLLVSELVTNAFVHGSGAIVLDLIHHDHVLRVSVGDASSGSGNETGAMEQTEAEELAESGRGLAIVAAVATKWGSHRDEGGIHVWFELDA
jgi:anti-sigma regulatory factor (Ser/Thr protein kinase)